MAHDWSKLDALDASPGKPSQNPGETRQGRPSGAPLPTLREPVGGLHGLCGGSCEEASERFADRPPKVRPVRLIAKVMRYSPHGPVYRVSAMRGCVLVAETTSPLIDGTRELVARGGASLSDAVALCNVLAWHAPFVEGPALVPALLAQPA